MDYDVQKIMTCYIANMINGDVIKFKALPEDVSESLDTSWEATDIRGRSIPYQSYAGNGPRSISFSVTLHADICDDIVGTVKRMKALVYPKYVGSIVIPPYCSVRIGKIISTKAIVNSVSVSWSDTILSNNKSNTEYDPDNAFYSKAEVSFDLSEIKTTGIPSVTRF